MTEINLKKIVKILLWAAAIIILAFILYQLVDLIVIIAISILLAFIFDPFVTMLEREGFNRFYSTLVVFVAFGFILYLGFSYFVPKFIYQMNQLIETLHVYSLHDQIVLIEKEIYNFLPFFNPGELATRIEEFLSDSIVNSFDKITEVLSSIVSIAAIIVIVPFITFFLLKDSRKILQSVLQMMPNNYFEMSYYILKKVSLQLGKFVRGWIFDATFVGAMLALGFYIIGIQNALPLGVIGGLGHLVPYFGPIIGGIPAAIVSIIQYGDLSQIPYIIIWLVAVYMMDNGFVQPYVFAKSVDMHPIVIILLILAGSQLLGLFGMLFAIPIATVVKTATKEIYFALKNYKIVRLGGG